jgi:hypothetical protein
MPRREPDPLRATLYLRRNWRSLLPVVLIIALATSLLVLVITPTNTFRRTNEADLAALRQFTIVAPLREKDFSPSLLQLLDMNPDMDRSIAARVFWIRYPMWIGEAFCPLILLEPAETQPMLGRLGVSLSSGRLPRVDSPEVVLHRDVAAARGLAVGDRFGAIVDPDDATPGEYEIVGLLDGRARVALGDYAHGAAPTYITSRSGDFQMVFAMPGRKAGSDSFLNDIRQDGGTVLQVIDDAYVQKRLDKALENLPLLQRSMAVAAASIVALVVALLKVIVFRSRIGEFGVLIAIGRTRGRLLRKLAAETIITSLFGWLAGLVLGYAGLAAYDHLALAPRGILLDVHDPNAAIITAILPIIAVTASVLALRHQLAKVDPIMILQGRQR